MSKSVMYLRSMKFCWRTYFDEVPYVYGWLHVLTPFGAIIIYAFREKSLSVGILDKYFKGISG